MGCGLWAAGCGGLLAVDCAAGLWGCGVYGVGCRVECGLRGVECGLGLWPAGCGELLAVGCGLWECCGLWAVGLWVVAWTCVWSHKLPSLLLGTCLPLLLRTWRAQCGKRGVECGLWAVGYGLRAAGGLWGLRCGGVWDLGCAGLGCKVRVRCKDVGWRV